MPDNNTTVETVYAYGSIKPINLPGNCIISHKQISPWFIPLWYSANRASRKPLKPSSMWFSYQAHFPILKQVVTCVSSENHRWYLQVWSWVIAQLEHWKTCWRGRQTGCGVSDGKKILWKSPSRAGSSGECAFGVQPACPLNGSHLY